jgi:hypothetical protein
MTSMQASLHHAFATAALGFVIVAGGACAKGDAIDTEGDGDGGAGGSGRGRTAADGPSGTTKTGLSGPGTTGASSPTTATSSGPTTTTSSGPTTTTSSGPTTTSAVTTGGGVDCQPENPAPGCGAGQHCVPQTSGDPVCEPAGAGVDYQLCPNGRGDCAPIYECVFDGFDACCMDWCQVGLNNCGGGETCTSFNTPVFIDGVEYGVCWDGLPCVI